MAPAHVLTRLAPGPTVLVVGYPAPAALAVVDRLSASDPRTIACVVSRDDAPEAAGLHRSAQASGRVRMYTGSAALPGLGLPCTAWRLLDTAEEIYCVASDEDLAARHIHDFADECPRLRRLHIVAPVERAPARRRGPGAFGATIRRLASALAGAVAVAGAGVVAPFALALAPWTELLDLDLATRLSWEDLERDLWPGTGQAT